MMMGRRESVIRLLLIALVIIGSLCRANCLVNFSMPKFVMSNVSQSETHPCPMHLSQRLCCHEPTTGIDAMDGHQTLQILNSFAMPVMVAAVSFMVFWLLGLFNPSCRPYGYAWHGLIPKPPPYLRDLRLRQ